jgi:radical SAM protein with 4Fe4S-binding SPASM domain
MSLQNFRRILEELKPFTREIALHIVGDPLTLSNLGDYLDIAEELNFKVHIVTSGYFMKNINFQTLLHKSIKQINFSLNSFNKNDLNISLDQYLEPILDFCKIKVERETKSFINLRVWNLDEIGSEKEFNDEVYKKLSKFFKKEIVIEDLKPFRLDSKVLLNFDIYFDWPDLNSKKRSDGFCHGLSSQIGFLSNGEVVPCCLDKDGILSLGNIFEKNLKDILATEKARNIKDGFAKGIAVEEFCKSCGYKERF